MKPSPERKCHICQGTGFHKGNICVCISNKGRAQDIPDFLKDLFRGVDEDTKDAKDRRT